MSYASTTIIHWGVELDPNQSEILYNYLRNNNLMDSYNGILMDKNDLTEYPCLPNLPSHIDGIDQPIYHDIPRYRRPRHIHDWELRSEGTDSRIDDNIYDQGCVHYFGVYCASKGYAYSDKISEVMHNIPQQAKDNFDKYCRPVLEELSLNSDPSVQIFNQTW